MGGPFGVGLPASLAPVSTGPVPALRVVTEYNVVCTGVQTDGRQRGRPCRKVIGIRLTRPWSVRCPRCSLLTERD